jgi:hypothetical protein
MSGGSSACGAPVFHPPPPPRIPGIEGVEVDEVADSVWFGIVLTECAVLLIALGANLQRYALAVVSPDARCYGCRRAHALHERAALAARYESAA